MKQKLLFGFMAAIIFGSLFVGLKFAAALPPERIWLDPEFKTIDPTPTQMTFLYDVMINTTYSVSMWEIALLWDPAVLRVVDVYSGGFMAPTDPSLLYTAGPSTALIAEYAQNSSTATGDGTLCQINFTFVLPGAVHIKFLWAGVIDDTLTTHLMATQDGHVDSNMPHAAFDWYCDDGINPLPNHTIRDGGDTIVHYDVVNFDASASYDPATGFASGSYDVGDLVWNGSYYEPGVSFPDIQGYFWDFGDGTNTTTYTPTTTHVYQDYNFDGYLVNLTVWDGEGSNWSSTWRYGGPEDDDTVPMWRDVAVVDFWPSLPPWELWDNGSGEDWYAWWWFDTVDYTIPRVSRTANYPKAGDPYYWAYEVSPYWIYYEDWFAPGPNAKDVGMLILVTFANYGSVPEYCKMTLWAQYFCDDLDSAPGPVYTHNKNTELYMVLQQSFTIQPGAGSGWNWYWAKFMPPKDGYYLLFATIEFEGAMHDDQNPDNNYMAAPQVLDTIWNWGYLTPDETYAKWRCDFDGNGRIETADRAIWSVAGWPTAPYERPPARP